MNAYRSKSRHLWRLGLLVGALLLYGVAWAPVFEAPKPYKPPEPPPHPSGYPSPFDPQVSPGQHPLFAPFTPSAPKHGIQLQTSRADLERFKRDATRALVSPKALGWRFERSGMLVGQADKSMRLGFTVRESTPSLATSTAAASAPAHPLNLFSDPQTGRPLTSDEVIQKIFNPDEKTKASLETSRDSAPPDLYTKLLSIPSSDPNLFNTITVDADADITGTDLTRFYSVNNRFLTDLGIADTQARSEEHESGANGAPNDTRLGKAQRAFADLSGSRSVAITAAKLAGNKEALTVFFLGDLAQHGWLRGRTFIISADDPQSMQALSLHLRSMSGGRVYLYGDSVNIPALYAACEENQQRVIRRSSSPPRSLLHADARLARSFDRLDISNTTVANGLPATDEAVGAMGFFAGPAELWRESARRVSGVIELHGVKSLTTSTDLIRELQEGDTNVYIVVAHADGLDLYFNGARVSFEELANLPVRHRESPRPRLAVLIVCGAGGASTQHPRRVSWWQMFGRQRMLSLAEILVQKGFVDQVIAPSHDIAPKEGLQMLEHALNGADSSTNFRNWVNWALVWMPASQRPA